MYTYCIVIYKFYLPKQLLLETFPFRAELALSSTAMMEAVEKKQVVGEAVETEEVEAAVFRLFCFSRTLPKKKILERF